MNETDKELIPRLKNEAGLPCRWAIPFVRYRGRCGYCGQDVLVDRQGYATAQIDHLLPQKCYLELKDELENWVLSCSLCNHTKRDWDPLKDLKCGDPLDMLKCDQRREELIARARAHINQRRRQDVDKEWLKVNKVILGYCPTAAIRPSADRGCVEPDH